MSEGEIIDELLALEMPYGFFRPDSGVRACMDSLRHGGPHHQVLNRGRCTGAWSRFCEAVPGDRFGRIVPF